MADVVEHQPDDDRGVAPGHLLRVGSGGPGHERRRRRQPAPRDGRRWRASLGWRSVSLTTTCIRPVRDGRRAASAERPHHAPWGSTERTHARPGRAQVRGQLYTRLGRDPRFCQRSGRFREVSVRQPIMRQIAHVGQARLGARDVAGLHSLSPARTFVSAAPPLLDPRQHRSAYLSASSRMLIDSASACSSIWLARAWAAPDDGVLLTQGGWRAAPRRARSAPSPRGPAPGCDRVAITRRGS